MKKKPKIVSVAIGFKGDPANKYVRFRYDDGTIEESPFDPNNPDHIRALKNALKPDPPFGGKSRSHTPKRAGGFRAEGSPPRLTADASPSSPPPKDRQPSLFAHND